MSEEVVAVPLLEPADGTPNVIDTEEAFRNALHLLSQGTGPFAVDAERASGFRYSARAYLIQIKRHKGGLHLIDPIPFGPGHALFVELNNLLNTDEVILHASTQDLPCLRELGINPVKLFDTELAGRIAGLPRVGLGPLLESLMGVTLAKEHSAADWSARPLPKEWLTYAALDVELLVELRDSMNSILEKVPDAHLLMVGQGPYLEHLAKLVAIHKVENHVSFIGRIQYAELPRFICAGDVFAMPSRSRLAGLEVEGLGIVYLEASACGLPVVAGDSGGAPDAVVQGVTGLVVDGTNNAQIASSIISLLNDPQKSQAMGAAGRQWIIDNWRWEIWSTRFNLLLEQ